MVQSPTRQAKLFAVCQEIPRISRNTKVHYNTHKPPPPVSIMGQPNPLHIPTSNLLEVIPNIIQPSYTRSPSGLFPSGSPTKTLYILLSSPIRAICPSHHILLDLITRKILGEYYRSFSYSLFNLFHSAVTSSLLGPNILINSIFSSTPALFSSSFGIELTVMICLVNGICVFCWCAEGTVKT